jgi:hypothetical protein
MPRIFYGVQFLLKKEVSEVSAVCDLILLNTGAPMQPCLESGTSSACPSPSAVRDKQSTLIGQFLQTDMVATNAH